VLLNETATGQIDLLWLKGLEAEQRDLFISSLPSTPDNISFNRSDMLWVVMLGLRTSLDAIAARL
jgi:hypothetical protein